MKVKFSPIIITGMHRSGTSVLTEIISKLGVFTGWQYDTHFEAVFFRNRNESILNAMGYSWSNIDDSFYIPENSITKLLIIEQLLKDISSPKIVSYIGISRLLKYGSVANIDFPWAWKDPRNGLLLPIWHEIFPDAKIINIVRNGMDVSSSLHNREMQIIENIKNDKRSVLRQTLSSIKQNTNRSNFIPKTLQILQEKFAKNIGLGKYTVLGYKPVVDLDYAFDLWGKYIKITNDNLRLFHAENVVTIRYEDLTTKPLETLKFINKKLKIFETEKLYRKNGNFGIKNIDRLKFLNDKSAFELFKKNESNYWLNFYYAPEFQNFKIK